jgi:hypothetical protein
MDGARVDGRAVAVRVGLFGGESRRWIESTLDSEIAAEWDVGGVLYVMNESSQCYRSCV